MHIIFIYVVLFYTINIIIYFYNIFLTLNKFIIFEKSFEIIKQSVMITTGCDFIHLEDHFYQMLGLNNKPLYKNLITAITIPGVSIILLIY